MNDLQIFSDNGFSDDLEASIFRILKEERNENGINGESSDRKEKEREQDSPRDTKPPDLKQDDEEMDSTERKDKLEEKDTKMDVEESLLVNGELQALLSFPLADHHIRQPYLHYIFIPSPSDFYKPNSRCLRYKTTISLS